MEGNLIEKTRGYSNVIKIYYVGTKEQSSHQKMWDINKF